MIEFDLAQNCFGRNRIGFIVDFRRCVDQLENSLRGRDGMLHLSIDARQVLYRPHHEREIRDESIDAANRHCTDHDLIAAVPNDDAQRHCRDDLHGGEEERREPRRAIRGAIHRVSQHLELFQVFVFALQRFDHTHALNVLIVCTRDLRVRAAAVAEFH